MRLLPSTRRSCSWRLCSKKREAMSCFQCGSKARWRHWRMVSFFAPPPWGQLPLPAPGCLCRWACFHSRKHQATTHKLHTITTRWNKQQRTVVGRCMCVTSALDILSVLARPGHCHDLGRWAWPPPSLLGFSKDRASAPDLLKDGVKKGHHHAVARSSKEGERCNAQWAWEASKLSWTQRGRAPGSSIRNWKSCFRRCWPHGPNIVAGEETLCSQVLDQGPRATWWGCPLPCHWSAPQRGCGRCWLGQPQTPPTHPYTPHPAKLRVRVGEPWPSGRPWAQEDQWFEAEGPVSHQRGQASAGPTTHRWRGSPAFASLAALLNKFLTVPRSQYMRVVSPGQVEGQEHKKKPTELSVGRLRKPIPTRAGAGQSVILSWTPTIGWSPRPRPRRLGCRIGFLQQCSSSSFNFGFSPPLKIYR